MLTTLLLLTSSALALAFPAKTLSLPPKSFQTPSCFHIGCTVEQSPVWDPVLQKCVCKWSLVIDPPVCPDIQCYPEMQLQVDPVTGKCGCVRRPGLDSRDHGLPLAARATESLEAVPTPVCLVLCIVGYVPAPDGSCKCVPTSVAPPRPTRPPTCYIKCAPGYTRPNDGSCRCIKIPETPPKLSPCATIKCQSGFYPREDLLSNTCSCVPRPRPTACEDMLCIAEKRPVFNPTTGRCNCKYIPSLEPGPPTTPLSVDADEPAALAARAQAAQAMCLLETTCLVGSQPAYDPKKKTCKCQGNYQEPDSSCLAATTCLVGSHLVFNTHSGKCTCVKDRDDDEFICIAATTCAPGSVPVWDPRRRVCNCVKV